MNGRYVAGAIGGGLAAGIAITAMMMAGERKSGKPSELIALERASARKLGMEPPTADAPPDAREQAVAQGGHLLLSALAGAAYAAATDEDSDPLVGGALFGLAFYGVAHWLTGPLLGVKAPEWTQGPATIAMHTANHVGFGLATAYAARAAARG